MFAITQWVWSWGSRLREVSWRKVATTVFWSPAWTIAPVVPSCIRVRIAFFSTQPRAVVTARS